MGGAHSNREGYSWGRSNKRVEQQGQGLLEERLAEVEALPS